MSALFTQTKSGDRVAIGNRWDTLRRHHLYTYIIHMNISQYTHQTHDNGTFCFHEVAPKASKEHQVASSLLSTTLHGPEQPRNLQHPYGLMPRPVHVTTNPCKHISCLPINVFLLDLYKSDGWMKSLWDQKKGVESSHGHSINAVIDHQTVNSQTSQKGFHVLTLDNLLFFHQTQAVISIQPSNVTE